MRTLSFLHPGRARLRCLAVLLLAIATVSILSCGAGSSLEGHTSPLTVSNDLPTARVGQAYSNYFTVTGGTAPYTFSGYGFPAGMNLDNVTGEFAGTPLAPIAGTTITVTVLDSSVPARSAVAQAQLIIKPLGVSITSESLDMGLYKVSYSAQIQFANGVAPFDWQIGPNPGSLPPDMNLDRQTGRIYGSPGAKGTWTFTVTVTDSDSPATSASKEFTLTIQ